MKSYTVEYTAKGSIKITCDKKKTPEELRAIVLNYGPNCIGDDWNTASRQHGTMISFDSIIEHE